MGRIKWIAFFATPAVLLAAFKPEVVHDVTSVALTLGCGLLLAAFVLLFVTLRDEGRSQRHYSYLSDVRAGLIDPALDARGPAPEPVHEPAAAAQPADAEPEVRFSADTGVARLIVLVALSVLVQAAMIVYTLVTGHGNLPVQAGTLAAGATGLVFYVLALDLRDDLRADEARERGTR